MKGIEQNPVHREIDRKARTRGRIQKAVVVVLALLVLSYCAMAARTILRNTDSIAAVRSDVFLDLVVAAIVLPLMILLYLMGYLAARVVGKGWPATRQAPGWLLGLVVPILAALAFVGWSGLDRIDPGRLFHEFAGMKMPPNARVVRHECDSSVLEDYLTIQFTAPVEEIRALLLALGVTSSRERGVESFDPVAVHGDYSSITVDWDHGLVTFEYLNV